MKNSKTIVVVGASKGIGKEIVLEFAKNKENKIIAFGRSESILREFSSLQNVIAFQLDLVSKNLVEELKKHLENIEKIDILINNAGKLINKPFAEITHQEMFDSYQVNVIGVMQTVQTLLPKMLEKGGHILNISSMGGFQGSVKFAGLSSYSTSKAAVTSFTELFAEEFKETKIKMNCLCLGAVQTEMLEEAFPGYKAPVTAVEMAIFIKDFAENGSSFFNGKILPVSLSTP